MTEQEWLECTDWLSMWEIVRHNHSERKLRLFSCACCRRIWDLLTDERSRKVVEVAEQFAEGNATVEDLQEADDAAYWAYRDAVNAAGPPAATALTASRTEIWRVLSASAYAVLAPAGKDQALILRCIFGNPFRPISINPTWLSWNDGTVRRIAQSIYNERAFDRLPILADALEDVGCDNADILRHCREPGEHVRGCWVVDLLLGKE